MALTSKRKKMNDKWKVEEKRGKHTLGSLVVGSFKLNVIRARRPSLGNF